MPVLDLQRSQVQLGRIRLGRKSAKGAPTSLDTFRLTSRHRDLLDTAAAIYGGEVVEWSEPASADRFELYTQASELPILVPPAIRPGDSALSQWYELWGRGGCVRRCDGERAILVDGRRGDLDCVCDPDERECDVHSRLQVILIDLDAFGYWRLDTKGINAARELLGITGDLARATAAGFKLPATLRIERRTWKGIVEGKGAVTNHFVVPVIIPKLPQDQAEAIAQGATYRPELAGQPVQIAGPRPVSALPAPQAPPEAPSHPGNSTGAHSAPPRRRGRPVDEVVPATTLPAPNAASSAAAEQTETTVRAGFDLIRRLPEPLQGKDAQGVRHDLYALAAEGWGMREAGLDGRARNRVVQWAAKYAAGLVAIDREDGPPPTLRLVDTATGEMIATVTSDLPSDQEAPT